MRHIILRALFIFSISLSAQPGLADSPREAGFAPLNVLVGEWQGTGSDGKAIRVAYRFTSGGTSLEETISPEKEPSMTTMYHLDNNRLMLTHYCSLDNQPRMRAEKYTEGDRALNFSFVDATNLSSPSQPHMHKVSFAFQDQDHFSQTWVLSKDGTEVPMTFQFERVK